MNHIRLLIRNQCGSHIIHGLPNPLAFQQNYSCYDGQSESSIFSPLDEPLLTSYLPDNDDILVPARELPATPDGRPIDQVKKYLHS